MIVKTKKYKIPSALYIRLGIQNVLRMQWWILVLIGLCMSVTFFVKTWWFLTMGSVAFVGYLVFWLVQFYGLTQLSESRLMFERVTYEISPQQLMMQINAKQGVPIPWSGLVEAKKKNTYFLLVLSKVQFFYLPFKIFNGNNEINFFTAVLQRKKLLK